MKLTPMDINNKEFKRGLRGYNPEEVDEFLDEVIENYEQLYKDNSKLKEKVTLANEQIEHYKKIESTIQNTLLLAQNAADQAKTSAEKEADMVIKNANETAQRILDKAHNDVLELNDEYEKMKQEFIKFRAKFRNFMNTQLQTFDDLEKDVLKNYNVLSSEEQIKNEEIQKEEDINNEVRIELEKAEVVKEQEEEEKEETIKEKEVNLDDTIDFGINSIGKHDVKDQKDEIDEIKSFFASDDDDK
ncbi:MAG: DivIVA domain-containing protein [Clostridiales bacterium]|nr:DivIVA domain-containing protein [Clostridiales bacterium]NLK24323.1 DivIVA domain-containing protein [Clostridiales bacterium]